MTSEKSDKIKQAISDTFYGAQLTFILSIICGVAYGNISSNIATKNVNQSDFAQNIFGTPFLAKNYKKPINVVIDENFNETQKEFIVEAIKDFDLQLDGLKYNIVLDGNKKGKNCINIKPVYNNDVEYSGLTQYQAKNFFARILYPVNISLNLSKFDFDSKSDYDIQRCKTFFETAVKHEMCHTLGLVDKYDNQSEKDTIMYWSISTNSQHDLTEKDLYTLNTVYKSNKGVSVEAKTKIHKPVIMNAEKFQVTLDEEDVL